MYKSIVSLLVVLFVSACAPKAKTNKEAQSKINEQVQKDLAAKVATLPKFDSSDEVFIEAESGRAMGPMARHSLIHKSRLKREDSSIFDTNERIIKANAGHTKVYPFRGKYRIIVIPVQFSDVKFEDKAFFKPNSDGVSLAQDYIFGENKNSMASYYKHSSMGHLNLEGEVTPIITVDKSLLNYGEAVTGKSDRYANGLVIDALKKLKKIKTNPNWWFKYDTWDLSDYDKDSNFHEPDGFLDAVVLIYAGKSQASCQRSFDADGTRPASADVPAGPRQAAAVECFNRIWPHRWSINMNEGDPDFSTKGPVVEGRQRPAMNGLKINDNLFAVDYNMQSEFSDRSTFIHEFGHSLSLPDVYSGGKANSTGSWEIMSSNARLQAQEFSSYSKITLGWLSPKIIEQGESTSAYLGAYNFVSSSQREDLKNFNGPVLNRKDETVVSTIPDSGESVYRSIMVITEPSTEKRDVIETTSEMGSISAYSSRFDGESRALSFSFNVPLEGDAKVSFDTIYQIETETNFNSKDEEIKIVTDYDIGQIVINDKVVEKLRLISGDKNYNTLNEMNPLCDEALVLASRKKLIAGSLSEEEKRAYKKSVTLCQAPTWVKKSIDLSSYRGQQVEFKINYVTDAGYTEFGIVVDNVQLPGQEIIDFEDNNNLGEFKALVDGSETLSFSQYYLMEHRLPKTNFLSDGKEASYNMDNNINVGGQSFFTKEGENQLDRYRMVTFDYQPGVLVWYFNSKYGRSSSTNTPVKNKGKGYLLVLNSKVGEVKLPGVFSDENLFDETGTYQKFDLDDDTVSTELEKLVKSQRDQFICFSHTVYATYLSGEAPICDMDFKDELKRLTFNGKSLIYERERSNEVLPDRRYTKYGAGTAYRTGATTRTGLSTFRPSDSEAFIPFKVFKAVDNKMVLDEKLTAESVRIEPVSKFNDADNKLHENSRFHGDTVVVEKKGFNFEVVSPSPQILGRYFDDIDPDSNESALRAPKTKIYFSWK
jgi:M6 family metalloprotease-like protein